jgi:uncharacterized protein (DUF885 family)
MARFSQRLWAGLLLLALGACGPAQAPKSTPAAASSPDVKDSLNHLTERYWDERIPVRTAIAPQVLADSLAVERRYLNEVNALSRQALDVDSRLTYDIFKRQREMLVEGFTYPVELLPLDSLDTVLQSIEVLSADSALQGWSVGDYDAWLKRVNEYANWTEQAISNMREGVRRGYVSPRFLIERGIAMLERPSADTAGNVFRTPLRTMPATLGEPDRTRLKNSIASTIDSRVVPATRALRDFLQHEYLPHGRSGIALTDLPLGEKWYAYDIRRATGSSLKADDIHAMGVAEVERLRARLPPEPEVAAHGPLPADELLKGYQDLVSQVDTAMMPLFADPPSAPLEVRGTEWMSDSKLPLLYRLGGAQGKPAAVLYVNLSPAAVRTGSVSLPSFLQQALPGHHLQATLAQQRVDLPRFRRMDDDPAFVEGWGLYAASLGEQLGLLTDETSKADAVILQLRCAVGLVVDTGLHAKGWTLKQALEYLHAQLPIDENGAQALVGFYAANPADALACKIGEMKMAALRAKAQQQLAGRFDIRSFHAAILQDGAMPMELLEAKMKLWMEAAR